MCECGCALRSEDNFSGRSSPSIVFGGRVCQISAQLNRLAHLGAPFPTSLLTGSMLGLQWLDVGSGDSDSGNSGLSGKYFIHSAISLVLLGAFAIMQFPSLFKSSISLCKSTLSMFSCKNFAHCHHCTLYGLRCRLVENFSVIIVMSKLGYDWDDHSISCWNRT